MSSRSYQLPFDYSAGRKVAPSEVEGRLALFAQAFGRMLPPDWEVSSMARFVFVGIGVLALATSAFAQVPNPAAPPGPFDKAVAAAPRQMREGAMVIKWKADGTYDTLRPGTNRLVCYDQSGEASEQPFSSQCTSVGNIERVKQNKVFEAKEADRAKREAALAEAEKAGTRVKPEFGSVFYTLSGADQATARLHVTISVPGATTATLGLPDNNKMGGAYIMNAGTLSAHIMTPGS
jgi:hypothetical protein